MSVVPLILQAIGHTFCLSGKRWVMLIFPAVIFPGGFFLDEFLHPVFGQELAAASLSAENNVENRRRPSVRLELDSATAAWTGRFLPGTGTQEVKFDRPATGRYFCLETLSAQDGRAYAAVAELDLLTTSDEVLNSDGWKIAYADS